MKNLTMREIFMKNLTMREIVNESVNSVKEQITKEVRYAFRVDERIKMLAPLETKRSTAHFFNLLVYENFGVDKIITKAMAFIYPKIWQYINSVDCIHTMADTVMSTKDMSDFCLDPYLSDDLKEKIMITIQKHFYSKMNEDIKKKVTLEIYKLLRAEIRNEVNKIQNSNN